MFVTCQVSKFRKQNVNWEYPRIKKLAEVLGLQTSLLVTHTRYKLSCSRLYENRLFGTIFLPPRVSLQFSRIANFALKKRVLGGGGANIYSSP